jgi:hypothetical protein
MSKLITYILYAGVLFLAAYAGQALNTPPPPPSLPVIKINSGDELPGLNIILPLKAPPM